MTDVHNLGLFILAGWLLNLTPGPDVLYIVSTHSARAQKRVWWPRWASPPGALCTYLRQRWG
jgi:hypothetical protein